MATPAKKREYALLFRAFAALSISQKKRFAQVVLFCSCIPVAGFIYLSQPVATQLEANLQIVPVCLVSLLAVVYILQATLFRKTAFFLLSSKKPVLAAFIVLFILAVCLLDILGDRAPLLLIPGMLAIVLIYWNAPEVIFVSAVAVSVGLSGEIYFTQSPLLFVYSAFFILASLLTALTSGVIRGNAMSSQKRVQTLQDENKELWNLSYRDPLTGLYNRRYMQHAAKIVFNRALRYREDLHVLMIDIDHFKKVNDKLGHAVGDEVLKAIAASIQAFVRSSDIIARYGGEEFIVYLVESNTEMAQFVANRIRDGVASLRIENVPWTVTISIGIASLKETDTIEDQIARADQFLYLSKKNGRNRVSGS